MRKNKRKKETTHGKEVGFKLGPYVGKYVGPSVGLNVGYTVGVPVGAIVVGLRLGRATGPNDAGASVVILKSVGPNDAGASVVILNSFCANAGTSPSSSTLSAAAAAGFRAAAVGAALGFVSSSAGFGVAEFGTVGAKVGLGASDGLDVATDPCRSSLRRVATIAIARTIIAATVAATLWCHFGILNSMVACR